MSRSVTRPFGRIAQSPGSPRKGAPASSPGRSALGVVTVHPGFRLTGVDPGLLSAGPGGPIGCFDRQVVRTGVQHFRFTVNLDLRLAWLCERCAERKRRSCRYAAQSHQTPPTLRKILSPQTVPAVSERVRSVEGNTCARRRGPTVLLAVLRPLAACHDRKPRMAFRRPEAGRLGYRRRANAPVSGNVIRGRLFQLSN